MEKNKTGFFTHPPSVNARYAYGAGGMRWCRIANVNEAIELKSLVSRQPKKMLSSQWHRVGLKWQHIVNCHLFW